MEKETTPKIIIEEAEARVQYQELKATGFEIYPASGPLSLEAFVALALEGGAEVVVRSKADLGGTGSREEREVLAVMSDFVAEDAYIQIRNAGLAIYLIQEEIAEDEFVSLAAERGRVNLRRLRPDGSVFVSYGSEIGFSGDPAPSFFSVSAFTEAIESFDMDGLSAEAAACHD